MEARAVEALFEKVVAGDLGLVSSFVVELEHSRLGEAARRERVGDLIYLARGYVEPSPRILFRARELESMGFGEGDALHLAAAERSRSDYFVTCDDRLLRRARRIGMPIMVVSPLGLFEKEAL